MKTLMLIVMAIFSLSACDDFKEWRAENRLEQCRFMLDNPRSSNASWREEAECAAELEYRDTSARLTQANLLCAKHGGTAWSPDFCVRKSHYGEEYSMVGEYPATIPVVWATCHMRYVNENDEECGRDDVNCTDVLPPLWCPRFD